MKHWLRPALLSCASAASPHGWWSMSCWPVCLFSTMGYRQVWDRLMSGLDGLGVPAPTAGGLTQARRRLGAKPLRFLFDLLRGPAAALSTVAGGVYRRGLLVCAIDGTVMSVADGGANLTVFSKQPGGANGGASYPDGGGHMRQQLHPRTRCPPRHPARPPTRVDHAPLRRAQPVRRSPSTYPDQQKRTSWSGCDKRAS